MRIEVRLAIMTASRGGGGGGVSRSCSWSTGRSARCVLPAPAALRALLGGSVPESAAASRACLLLSALAIASQCISTAKKSEKKLDDLVAFVKATIDVKSTELMLRPGTIVVSTPLTRLVSLDKQGAVYDSVIAVFMLGGAATSGQQGGCRQAPDGELGAEVYAYGGTVELPYIFELRRACLQCFGFGFFGVACAPHVSLQPCGKPRAESRVECRVASA